jgi:quercetin dioxygenase-like cupin family protein
MKVIRATEVDRLAAATPSDAATLAVNWLAGPTHGAPLDVGMVTISAGGVAAPHSHNGGQVIFVLTGRGFVETAAGRVSVGPGDLVISPPDEMHTHGAEPDASMSHLTVATGGYEMPDPTPAEPAS